MMKAKKQMLKDVAYDHIRTKILHYELPPGMDLSEELFAQELNMSRTPIREALQQLSQEGYVDIYPHKGIFVSQLSYQDMYELYRVRLFFELPCIPYICQTVQTEPIRSRVLELRDYFMHFEYPCGLEQLDEWTQKDRELHRIIVDSYGNHQLSLLYDIAVNKIMRIRYLMARNLRSRTDDASAEHVRIIDAIMAGDRKTTEQELAKHIDVPIHLQVLFEDITRQQL